MLIIVQFILPDIIEVCRDMLQGFVYLAHLDHFFIVIGDVLLDNAHQHIVGVQAVAAVLIYIFQKSLLAVVPHEDVIQMLPDVLCQQRHYDVRLPGHLVESDKIGMFHLGAVERTVTGFYAFFNGRFPVIVPVPLVTHQCG